jgi:hypothetical protein
MLRYVNKPFIYLFIYDDGDDIMVVMMIVMMMITII